MLAINFKYFDYKNNSINVLVKVKKKQPPLLFSVLEFTKKYILSISENFTVQHCHVHCIFFYHFITKMSISYLQFLLIHHERTISDLTVTFIVFHKVGQKLQLAFKN